MGCSINSNSVHATNYHVFPLVDAETVTISRPDYAGQRCQWSPGPKVHGQGRGPGPVRPAAGLHPPIDVTTGGGADQSHCLTDHYSVSPVQLYQPHSPWYPAQPQLWKVGHRLAGNEQLAVLPGSHCLMDNTYDTEVYTGFSGYFSRLNRLPETTQGDQKILSTTLGWEPNTNWHTENIRSHIRTCKIWCYLPKNIHPLQ